MLGAHSAKISARDGAENDCECHFRWISSAENVLGEVPLVAPQTQMLKK